MMSNTVNLSIYTLHIHSSHHHPEAVLDLL